MQPAYEAVPKNTQVEMVQRGCPKGDEVPREPVQSNVEPDDTTDHIHEVGREKSQDHESSQEVWIHHS